MRLGPALGLALALAACVPAWACGVCVEDKVAAAYDHAVVARALDAGHVMVFAELVAPGGVRGAAGAVKRAAGRVAGVDRESVRVVEEPPVLSFALDMRVRTPAQALAAVQRAAGEGAPRLRLLKVMP